MKPSPSITISHRALASLAMTLIIAGQACVASDLSKFLHSVFENAQNASNQRPDAQRGQSLNYHFDVSRQQGPLEGMIQLYGSDDFYRREGHGDPNAYINRVYKDFVGRDPRYDELQFYRRQGLGTVGARIAMLRWLCNANHITQLPSPVPRPPIYRPPVNLPAIAADLSNKCSDLIRALKIETQYTPNPLNLLHQAGLMRDAANQFQIAASRAQRDPQSAQKALRDLGASKRLFEADFYRRGSSYPQSTIALQQITTLMAAAQRSFPTLTPRPPAGPSINCRNLVDQSRSFLNYLRDRRGTSALLDHMLRDMEQLADQIERFASAARYGSPSNRLQSLMRDVIGTSDYLANDAIRADPRTRRAWLGLQSEIVTIARSLGLEPSFCVQPNRPVLINCPTWGGLPYHPPIVGTPDQSNQCVYLADQLLDDVNRYLVSLKDLERQQGVRSESVFKSVKRFLGVAQDFRRSASSGGYRTSLKNSADRLVRDYRRVSRDVSDAIKRDLRFNSPAMFQIGELVRQIEQSTRNN